jgi:hypothetical protein
LKYFHCQDAASRFTLDSATDFLFGTDVRTLSVGLPYPASSPLAKASSSSPHFADRFARAFAEAQVVTAVRSFWADSWPLAEFWEDKTKKHMKIVHGFIEPILKEAVERKRASGRGGETRDPKDDIEVKEDETFLDHLVNYTEGMHASFLLHSQTVIPISLCSRSHHAER